MITLFLLVLALPSYASENALERDCDRGKGNACFELVRRYHEANKRDEMISALERGCMAGHKQSCQIIIPARRAEVKGLEDSVRKAVGMLEAMGKTAPRGDLGNPFEGMVGKPKKKTKMHCTGREAMDGVDIECLSKD